MARGCWPAPPLPQRRPHKPTRPRGSRARRRWLPKSHAHGTCALGSESEQCTHSSRVVRPFAGCSRVKRTTARHHYSIIFDWQPTACNEYETCCFRTVTGTAGKEACGEGRGRAAKVGAIVRVMERYHKIDRIGQGMRTRLSGRRAPASRLGAAGAHALVPMCCSQLCSSHRKPSQGPTA